MTSRRSLTTVFLLLIASLAVLGSSAPAMAASFTSENPASVLHAQPSNVSVDVFSTRAIDTRSPQIQVDGVAYKTSVTNVGSVSGGWTSTQVWNAALGVWAIRWTWTPSAPDSTRATLNSYPVFSPPLHEGTHNVVATVKDVAGTPLTDRWSFSIQIPPTIGSPTPADGSTVTTTSPLITVPAADNTGVTRSTATVNGASAPSAFSGGVVRITPPALPNDATSTVTVTVFDAAGNSATRTWSFFVETYPEMLSTIGDCASCHPTAATDPDMGAACSLCHAGQLDRPHQGAPASYHARANSACSGAQCHIANITAEHARWTTLAGAQITCATCHQSTRTSVIAAISSGNSNCGACHDANAPMPPNSSAAIAKHEATLSGADFTILGTDFGRKDCTDCHATNLQPEHKNVCSTCHPTPRDSVLGEWDKTCVTAGCHTPSSPAPMHQHLNSAHTATIPGCTATGCHAGGSNIALIHQTQGCDTCHSDGQTPSATCTECHNTTTPHGDISGDHLASPAAQTISISGKAFGSHACSECHSQLVISDLHGDACSTCHPALKNALTPSWDRSCAQGGCHTAGSTKPMHGAIDALHTPGVANSACFASGCHTMTSVADLHSVATTTVAGATRTSCQICHAPGVTPTVDCSQPQCHGAAGPHTDLATPHTATLGSASISIGGSDYGIHACAECHTSANLLDSHSGSCATCHPAPKNTLTPSWNKSCAQGGCHTTGSTKPLHGTIDTAHLVPVQACTAIGCHANRGGSLAALHSGVTTTTAGVTRTSCQICHDTGVTPTDQCSVCHDMATPHTLAPADVHEATFATETVTILGANLGDHRCSECHSSSTLTDIHADCSTCHPSPKDTLTPSWDKSCAQGGCHTTGSSAPKHGNIDNAHRIGAQGCLTAGCHIGVGNLALVHSQATTTVAGVTLTSCQICHAAGRTPSSTCTDCHDTASPHPATTTHSVSAPSCSTSPNCHNMTPGDVKALHKNHCEDCHDRDDGVQPSTNCADCHGSNTAYSHGYDSTIHSAAPTGSVTIVGTTFDDIVCASCHNPSSITPSTPNGTLALGPLHDNGCPSCHPGVVPNVVSAWNKTCAQSGCHSATNTAPGAQPLHVKSDGTTLDQAHNMVPVAKDCLAGGKCHSGTSLPQIHEHATLTDNGVTYTGCQVCHKNSLNIPVVPDFTSPDGSVWHNECLGCHPDRWAQHGYNSTWHTTNFTQQDVVSSGMTISDITCADCHARNTETPSTPKGTLEIGPIHAERGLACDNCHPTPRDTFATWNKTCDEPGCHGVTSTQPMHGAADAAHAPTPGTSCMIDGCHLKDTTAPGWGSDLPQIHRDATATVNGQVVKGCMVCHFNNEFDPNGTGVTFTTNADGIPSTKECAECHPQGGNTMHAYSFQNHTSSPAAASITIGATTWPQMACTRCHFAELSSEHARNISGFKSNGCFNCHPEPYNSLEAQGQAIGGWNKGCVQAGCHAVGGANEMHRSVTASHTPLPANTSCMGSSCHSANGATLADIHSKATTTVAGVVRTQCDVCHGDFATQSQPPSADCTFCHANKVLAGGAVAPHFDADTLHPTTSSAGCSADSNSCHSSTLAKEHSRRKTPAGVPLTCGTCHDSTDPLTVAAIKNGNTACEACHTTHHGTQSPVSSASCEDCHGSTSTEISSVSTSGVYANTGGDHATGFSSAAHASVSTTPTPGSSPTTIGCTVCHDHSRTTLPKYINFRYTGWPTPAQNHEDLCFQCHTAAVTVYNEPKTVTNDAWNGRSVQAQFQLVSKHTISTGSGSYVDQEFANYSDTTQAQFNLDSQSNVVVANVNGGEVKLAQDLTGGVNPPAVTGLLFAKSGGSTALDQYSTTDGTWDAANTAKFTPAAAPGSPATGASAFRIPSDPRIFFPTASTCYVYTPPADPTADSWATSTNFAAGAALGAGGDTAVNSTGDTTTGQCIYYLRGGGQSRVYMKPFAGSSSAVYTTIQYPSGTSLSQGAGSAIAYAPTSNRTFVINRNGTSGDGKLYYAAGLNRLSSGTTVLTQGPSVTTSASTTVYNRLTCATIGGTDYLFSVGPNMTGSLTLQVVTNVASAPSLLGIGVKPPTGWTSTGDGCDLKYNSADGYLYATRGGSNASFARIQIPANPGNASSWTGVNWQALATSPTLAAGSSFEFADADAPLVTPFKFYGAGTITSAQISPISGAKTWGKLTFSTTLPANTALSIAVKGYNGSTWDTLVPAATTSPVDLSAYDCASYPKLQLTATLSTNDPYTVASTPQLNDWSVSNIKQSYVPPSGSYIQCENCHNTHLVQKGSGAWDKNRVVNPNNVKQLWSGSWADYCLTCHTGTDTTTKSLSPTITATTIIPYTVAFRPVTAPFFAGFNKTLTGMDWGSAGHNPLNGTEVGVISQTTTAAFSADTLNQTAVWNTAGGEVKLAQNPLGQPNPVAQNGVAFVNAGGSINFDQYLYDSWDTTNTLLGSVPATMPAASATGASSFKIPGDNSIFVMTGSSTYQYTPGVEPSWDSWTTNSNLVPQRAQAIGCDTAVNGNAGVVYTTRSGANATIYTRLYASPYTANSMTFSAGSLGVGSSIAYAPTADRLFVVYKNATTSADGKLYYLAAPGVKTGTQTFTAGPQLTASGTTSVVSRMSVATVSGTDYLFFLGPNSSNALSFQVVSNLGSTPTTVGVPVPTGWTSVGDGCDLEYNSADGYLYAIRGGGLPGFARIQVPATPSNPGSWGSWQSLSQMRAYPAGTTLAFANVDPIPGGTYTLYGAGTVTSPDISAPGGALKWGNLTFTSVIPANTGLSITVQGYNSNTSSWDTLIPATSVSPTSLKTFPTSLYPKIRLVGSLSTTALTTKSANPEIDDWAVTAITASTNSPSCNNCHDPHGSNNGALVAYTSLDNTTVVRDNSSAEAGSGLCYKCHGTGTGARMNVQGPAGQTYGHPIAASGAIHNDEETTASLITNRHADCSDCHNPHAAQKGLHTAFSSSNGSSKAGAAVDGVLGVGVSSWGSNFATPSAGAFQQVMISSGASPISRSAVPTTSVEAYLCFKCHTSAGGNIRQSVTTNSGTYVRSDLAQEFNPNNFSFHNVTGASVAEKASVSYTDKGGTARTQAFPIPTVAWLKTYNGVQLTSNSQITCTDCHTGGLTSEAAGPHGSSVKWMIDPNYTAEWTGVTVSTMNSASYICRKCHDFSVLSVNPSGSSPHGSSHTSYKCSQCHVAIPHGWKRPRLLAYATDGAPYFTGGTGLTGISSTKTFTLSSGAVSWSKGDCYTNCGEHSGAGTTIMP